MKTQLLNIGRYLLLLDVTSEIQPNDIVWHHVRENIGKVSSLANIENTIYIKMINGMGVEECTLDCNKIIAYRSLGEQKELYDLPLLPNLRSGKLVSELSEKYPYNYSLSWEHSRIQNAFRGGFTDCFNKYGYSKDDLKKAMLLALEYGYALRSGSLKTKDDLIENFLKNNHNELIIEQLYQTPTDFILGSGDDLTEKINNGSYKF